MIKKLFFKFQKLRMIWFTYGRIRKDMGFARYRVLVYCIYIFFGVRVLRFFSGTGIYEKVYKTGRMT